MYAACLYVFLQYLQEQVGKDKRDTILCLESSQVLKVWKVSASSWQTKSEDATLMVLYEYEYISYKSIILKGKLSTHLTDIDGHILLFICSVAQS